MDAQLFALVSAENPKLIFAWGMEISHRDNTEAVIYRHDPRSGHSTTGLHTSAEAALARWSRLGPLELRWEPTLDELLDEAANLTL